MSHSQFMVRMFVSEAISSDFCIQLAGRVPMRPPPLSSAPQVRLTVQNRAGQGEMSTCDIAPDNEKLDKLIEKPRPSPSPKPNKGRGILGYGVSLKSNGPPH